MKTLQRGGENEDALNEAAGGARVELFGEWQTEEYKREEARDGKAKRSEFLPCGFIKG